MSLFDRLTLSTPHASFAERVRMNNLAAAIYMLSQGVPFLQAGEEILRSKPLPGGGFEHNSYASPDSINSIKWNDLSKPEYAANADYYRGLIAFRKAHPTLRLTSDEAVREQIHAMEGLESNVVGFHLRGSVDDPAQAIIVLYNPNKTPTTVQLPKGRWNICITDKTAGTEPLLTVEGGVSVAPISACVLTLEPVASLMSELDLEQKKLPLLLGVTAAVTAAVGGAMALLTHKRSNKKDNNNK
jgi:pullulanase